MDGVLEVLPHGAESREDLRRVVGVVGRGRLLFGDREAEDL